MPTFTFRLDPVPPFRLDYTAWALRRRPENGIDRFGEGVYSRMVTQGDHVMEVCLSQTGTVEEPHVKVQVRGEDVTSSVRPYVAATVEKMFAMQLDLASFYRMAHHDRQLRTLAGRFRGLKPPRFPTVFEAAVNGIACQQLSLAVGITLLTRLSEACGLAMETDVGLRHAFPRPPDLVRLRIPDLRGLGFSTRKAEYLLRLSEAVVTGQADLEALVRQPRDRAIETLMQIRGVGRWTAEYVLLRGAGDLSAFPGDDVGGRNKLQRWLNIEQPLTYEAVRQITSKYRPYPGLIYFHLLLDELGKKGYV